MEILNIGPLELILFLVIAFLLLGPKGMILTAYKIGQWIRQALRSPMWREMLRSAQDIRELPKKIVDESGLNETLAEIQAETREAVNDVNASIREAQLETQASIDAAKAAARVPEAEHVRIDSVVPLPEITPATNSVPAARQTYPPPVYSENPPPEAYATRATNPDGEVKPDAVEAAAALPAGQPEEAATQAAETALTEPDATPQDRPEANEPAETPAQPAVVDVSSLGVLVGIPAGIPSQPAVVDVEAVESPAQDAASPEQPAEAPQEQDAAQPAVVDATAIQPEDQIHANGRSDAGGPPPENHAPVERRRTANPRLRSMHAKSTQGASDNGSHPSE